ncbi:MAG: collagen-like protein [Lachnospiraceae bacterium]|jgi:hypothetical protein|nr:collagen-like protein [Lachnospiraceae bacterium]
MLQGDLVYWNGTLYRANKNSPVRVLGTSPDFDLVNAVGSTGPTGPTGAQGPQGIPGAAGPAPVLHALMSVSDVAQAPGRNGLIYFTDSLFIKGTDIVHPVNTGRFSLVANGTYEISYHTVGTNSASVNSPVLVGVHLTANNAVIPRTTSLATVSRADNTSITVRKLD